MFIPLSELLTRGRADNHPVALGYGESEDKVYSFKQFRDDVCLNVSELNKLKPTKVVLAAEDSYRFAVGLLAILHAGCRVVLPANTQPGTLENLLTDKATILADIEMGGGSLEILSGHADITLKPLQPEKCFIDFFTSGSSAIPQKIPKKLVYLEKEAHLLDRYWGDVVTDSKVLSTVTHQHLYGLTFKILWPLCSGRPFVTNTFSYWEHLVLELGDPCCVISSPAHLTRYPPLETVCKNQHPRMIISAGAPLSYEAAQNTRQILGTLPTEIFGSTETCVVAHRQQNAEKVKWTPFEGVQVEPGDEDALRIKSPMIDGEEWYQMNDIAEFSSDGHFLLKGRSDRVAKIEGKRVSLTEIESFLTSLEWVDDAVTVILDDEKNSLAAVISLNDRGEILNDQRGSFRFSRQLRQEMSLYFDQSALPRRWRFVERIPVNSQGKRIKSELEALFMEHPHIKWADGITLPEVLNQTTEQQAVVLSLYIAADLFQFQGHFPEKPVLPGVAQLDWVVLFAESHLGIECHIDEVSQLKFRSLITPDTHVDLYLEHQPEKNRIRFEYKNNEMFYSSGFIKLVVPDND